MIGGACRRSAASGGLGYGLPGEISLFRCLFFMIVSSGSPPHFWALALLRQKEYGAVTHVPMLPVIATNARATGRF